MRLNYTCPKCGNRSYDTDEFRATGGFLTKLLDIQTKKFSTVTCTRCQYTEIFRAESSSLGHVFDFFVER